FEHRAAAVGRATRNRPAVSFDDFRADEQAKTGARNRPDALRTIASFEDTSAVCLRYADPVITNRDRCGTALGAYVDIDLSTIRRIFDRVADQILKHPLDAPLVVIDHHRVRRSRIAERVTPGDRLHLVLGGLDCPPEIGRAALQSDPIALNRMQ